MSAAGARKLIRATPDRGVGAGLTSTTTPPARWVRRGSEAAGWTTALVPTTRQTSADSAAGKGILAGGVNRAPMSNSEPTCDAANPEEGAMELQRERPS